MCLYFCEVCTIRLLKVAKNKMMPIDCYLPSSIQYQVNNLLILLVQELVVGIHSANRRSNVEMDTVLN